MPANLPPSIDVPAYPDENLPARKLRVTSASIGFSLGLHL